MLRSRAELAICDLPRRLQGGTTLLGGLLFEKANKYGHLFALLLAKAKAIQLPPICSCCSHSHSYCYCNYCCYGYH